MTQQQKIDALERYLRRDANPDSQEAQLTEYFERVTPVMAAAEAEVGERVRQLSHPAARMRPFAVLQIEGSDHDAYMRDLPVYWDGSVFDQRVLNMMAELNEPLQAVTACFHIDGAAGERVLMLSAENGSFLAVRAIPVKLASNGTRTVDGSLLELSEASMHVAFDLVPLLSSFNDAKHAVIDA
jgi:hypothetical protein